MDTPDTLAELKKQVADSTETAPTIVSWSKPLVLSVIDRAFQLGREQGVLLALDAVPERMMKDVPEVSVTAVREGHKLGWNSARGRLIDLRDSLEPKP